MPARVNPIAAVLLWTILISSTAFGQMRLGTPRRITTAPAARSGSTRSGASAGVPRRGTSRTIRSGATTREAPPPIDPLASVAAAAVADGTLAEFTTKVEGELKPLLSPFHSVDADQIIRLETWHEFGRYFQGLSKASSTDRATLQWLANQPKLLTALMLSVANTDSPDQVLRVLSALRRDQNERLEEYPQLTAAMCVVWDAPSLLHAPAPVTSQEPPDEPTPTPRIAPQNQSAIRPLWLMRYYIALRNEMRMDPNDLPTELAVYIVDNQVNDEDDAAWARQRYAQRGALGGSFFDVPYDLEQFAGTSPARIAGHPYTLENLALYGGMCGDQAYFAVQVARCLGVPAVMSTGVGSGGIAHAWVGYLSEQGNRLAWDFQEGRYPEDNFWQGSVLDPQTRRPITDADVSVLAELADVSPLDRELSVALRKSAELLDPAERPALLMQAIELSPGNRQAWLDLARGPANAPLSAAQTADLKQAVIKFALSPYPDFAFSVLSRATEARPIDEQIQALDEMFPLFARRPDLSARIHILQGNALARANRKDDALAAYGEVLDGQLNIGPVVFEAVLRTDAMLRESRKLEKLADIYQHVWQRMPQPQNSGVMTGTPYYEIGSRYMKLLTEIGEDNDAQVVQARLESLTASSAGPQ